MIAVSHSDIAAHHHGVSRPINLAPAQMFIKADITGHRGMGVEPDFGKTLLLGSLHRMVDQDATEAFAGMVWMNRDIGQFDEVLAF